MKSVPSAAGCFKKTPNIAERRFGDRIVLIPVHANLGKLSNIFMLEAVGALIWQSLDGSRTIQDLVQRVVQEFDVTADVAERDVAAFLKQLQDIGAVA